MPHKVDCCSKYFLFGFNVIFWLVALFLIGIGIWAWFEKGFFDNLTKISALPVDPVIAVNGVGLVMFLLTFAGCVGSLRENIFLLKCFAFFLSVIFFAEIIVGILGFVYKGWFSTQFATFVNSTIENYRDDPDLQNIIDFTQDYFQCCGGVGPDDWDNNIYFNCTSTVMVNGAEFTLVESCGVPFSCCTKPPDGVHRVVNTQCGYGVRDKDRFSPAERVSKIQVEGCIASFEGWAKTNLYTVGGVLIGVALLQIIPICIAQNVVSDITSIQARWQAEGMSSLPPPHHHHHQRHHHHRGGPSSSRNHGGPRPVQHRHPQQQQQRSRHRQQQKQAAPHRHHHQQQQLIGQQQSRSNQSFPQNYPSSHHSHRLLG